MTACEQVEELLPAVALDVATAQDELEVRRHLVRCPECADLLDHLRETSQGLAYGVPMVEPPADLRLRVLAAAAAQPAPEARPRVLPRRLHWPRVSAAWGATAAALVVSAGSLVWAARLQGDVSALAAQDQALREKAARYDRIVGVLDSRAITVRTLQPGPAGESATGTVYLDPASGVGMATLRDLPVLPEDRAYQIWFGRNDGGRMSAGLVRPDPQGHAYVVIQVPNDLENYRVIGFTTEPATGSPAPTSPRVVGTDL